VETNDTRTYQSLGEDPHIVTWLTLAWQHASICIVASFIFASNNLHITFLEHNTNDHTTTLHSSSQIGVLHVVDIMSAAITSSTQANTIKPLPVSSKISQKRVILRLVRVGVNEF
jgi:hypothetical protein